MATKVDIRDLGVTIGTIKTKLEVTITHTIQNTTCLESLQQLNQALAKIDDLENRSRRYNFRLQGLPESIKELKAAV